MEETFENLYSSWLFVIKAEKLDSCPLCGHDRLAYEGGIYICEQCQSEMKEFMDKTERSVWFRRIGG
jgi:ribosomal protein L37AE/L43A